MRVSACVRNGVCISCDWVTTCLLFCILLAVHPQSEMRSSSLSMFQSLQKPQLRLWNDALQHALQHGFNLERNRRAVLHAANTARLNGFRTWFTWPKIMALNLWGAGRQRNFFHEPFSFEEFVLFYNYKINDWGHLFTIWDFRSYGAGWQGIKDDKTGSCIHICYMQRMSLLLAIKNACYAYMEPRKNAWRFGRSGCAWLGYSSTHRYDCNIHYV